MFANYPINPDYIVYGPRIYPSSYPRTRIFYQPTQSYFRPCSYYHNNTSPFYYSRPQNYSYFDDEDDEEDEREELFRDLLNRKMAYEQREEREREEREREQQEQLKGFYEHKAREQVQRPGSPPKKSFRVKIQGGEDETKSQAAARKIFNFIKNQTANKRTLKILDKFYSLRTIENELKEVRNSNNFGDLTFVEEREKQVLPISAENKRFLEYEDKILRLFDKLDRIQSEGVDIVRDRRKFLVKSAQALLDELDNEKENQWKAFSEKQLTNPEAIINENSELNSDVVMNDDENSDISSSSDSIQERISDIAIVEN